MTGTSSSKAQASFFIRLLGISLAVVMVLNFFLFLFRKVSVWWFWGVIIFCAVMAWGGIPLLRKIGNK